MEKTCDDAPEEGKRSRRSFGATMINVLGAVIGTALAIPAALYLFLPSKSRKDQTWVEAGDLTQIQSGVPEEVTFRRIHADGWKVHSEKGTAWVVKTADGKVLAFSPICTHLGCAYHWDRTKSEFICPCHGSEFSITGAVLSGPAPRPLDRFEVKVENARLWLGPIHQSPETSS